MIVTVRRALVAHQDLVRWFRSSPPGSARAAGRTSAVAVAVRPANRWAWLRTASPSDPPLTPAGDRVEAGVRTSHPAPLKERVVLGVDEHIVHDEAPLFRMEVRDHAALPS
jgi:hypothetical protein